MIKKPSEGRRTKVALLGCALETLPLAPFDNPEWEIWSSGQWQEAVKRWDVWFELHDLENLNPSFKFHLDWLPKQTKPIYVARPSSFVPHGKIYPRDEMEAKYGKEFFTSVIAWMFVKAMEDGYEEIGLYGVEMACDAEYFYQRPGIKHFEYLARDKGIKVTIPGKSLLALEKETYPFCQESPLTKWIVQQDKKVQDQLKVISEQHGLLALKIAEHKGAEQFAKMVKRQVGWPD